MVEPGLALGMFSLTKNLVETFVKELNHVRKAWKENEDFDTRWKRLNSLCVEFQSHFTEVCAEVDKVAKNKEADSIWKVNSQQINMLAKDVKQYIEKANSVLGDLIKKAGIDESAIGPGPQPAKQRNRMIRIFEKVIIREPIAGSSSQSMAHQNEASEIRVGSIPKATSEQIDENTEGCSSRPGKRWNLMRRGRDAVLAGLNIDDSVIKTLDSVESCLKDAKRDTSSILSHLLLKNVGTAPKPASVSEHFKTFFDRPLLPENVILDFDPESHTSEELLLRSILGLLETNGIRGVSAVGCRTGATHGMGGVGKTTALRARCYKKEVEDAFPHGVCFMEFGQDANNEKVVKELSRCVRNFGGATVAQEINESSRLGDAVELVSAWFLDKAVLFVCDDLWPLPENELGYIPHLRSLLRNSSGSALLISTRNSNIAESVGNAVLFEALERYGSRSRQIVGRAAFGDDFNDISAGWACETEFQYILDVCAGLPLALAIAGRGINSDFKVCRRAVSAIRKYFKRLKRQTLQLLMNRPNSSYPAGLRYVVEASLTECERWGHDGRNYGMRQFFKSFCVLEKQMTIPESVLRGLWEVTEAETDEIARMFSELSLVKRELCYATTEVDEEKEPLYGIRLHDLVLALCQDMVVGEEISFHSKLVDFYSSAVSDPRGPQGKLRSWWDLEDDGYAYSNLSRHMAAGGKHDELQSMLCDVRWTLRRTGTGGWPALNSDFLRSFEKATDEELSILRELRALLLRCWTGIKRDRGLFAFYLFGHLSQKEREANYIAPYLRSVLEHLPTPCLHPLNKCIGPRDKREDAKWLFDSSFFDVHVSWSTDRMILGFLSEMKVWSITRQEELFSIPTGATCVALSENGAMIVSAKDKIVRRWNARSGASIGEPLCGHEEKMTSVAISSDGTKIVSASEDKTVRRWNAWSGVPIGKPLCGHEDKVTSIAISGDGTIIVSASKDKTVRRWDAQNGLPIGEPMCGHEKGVLSVAVSPDGTVIASGSDDKTVRRWDARSGAPIGEASCGHDNVVTSVEFSRDGTFIVSGSGDETVRCWNARSGASIGEPLRGHFGSVMSAAVNVDGTIVISSSWDSTVRQWDVRSRVRIKEPLLCHDHNNVDSVVGGGDGSIVVGGYYDGSLQRFDAGSGAPIGEPMVGHRGNVHKVLVTVDGAMIVSWAADNAIQLWDAQSGESIGKQLLKQRRLVTSLALSGDGTMIVTGLRNGKVRRWDVQRATSIGEPLCGHSENVCSVAISENGTMIVSGSVDKTVRRWNAQSGAPIGKPLCGHEKDVISVAISGDGTIIVSASKDNTVRRWNAQSGELVGEPLRISGRMSYFSVVVSRAGSTVICGSEKGPVWRWDGLNGAALSGKETKEGTEGIRIELPRETTSVAFEATKIVLGLRNGCVAVCEWRLAHAKSRRGQSVT